MLAREIRSAMRVPLGAAELQRTMKGADFVNSTSMRAV
jgi:hypothetical protein